MPKFGAYYPGINGYGLGAVPDGSVWATELAKYPNYSATPGGTARGPWFLALLQSALDAGDIGSVNTIRSEMLKLLKAVRIPGGSDPIAFRTRFGSDFNDFQDKIQGAGAWLVSGGTASQAQVMADAAQQMQQTRDNQASLDAAMVQDFQNLMARGYTGTQALSWVQGRYPSAARVVLALSRAGIANPASLPAVHPDTATATPTSTTTPSATAPPSNVVTVQSTPVQTAIPAGVPPVVSDSGSLLPAMTGPGLSPDVPAHVATETPARSTSMSLGMIAIIAAAALFLLRSKRR